jgi:hypothetical protein
VAGLIVTGFGYPAIFLFAALSAAIAMSIALALQRSARGSVAAGQHQARDTAPQPALPARSESADEPAIAMPSRHSVPQGAD